MKQECLSCRNAFRFFDGECNCYIESDLDRRNKDDYWCDFYDAVDIEAYEERVAWKQRQEKESLYRNIQNTKK